MRQNSKGLFRAAIGAVASLLLVPATLVPVLAQALDGDALRVLALRGTWKAEHPEYGFWTWDKNGTVCLRVGTQEGDCADTGTWEINENALCYELTWWGESAGERINCFTVSAIDGQRFETLFHGSTMVSRMFAFAVRE
jgi:hypothetical protein